MNRLAWVVSGACLAVALACGVYAWRSNAGRADALERAAAVEKQALRDKGVLTAELTSTKDAAAAALKNNASLQKQLDAARAVEPRVKIVRVVEIKTVEVPAKVPVAEGDAMFARVHELGIRTTLGNESAVGTVDVFKAPSTLVFSSKFDASASRLTVDPVASCPPPPSAVMAVAIACGVCGGAAVAADEYFRRR